MGAFRALGGLLLAACMALGPLLATGCGSSAPKSNETSTGPSAAKATVQTKASYIAQVDAICKQGNTETASIAKDAERIIHAHLGVAREAEEMAPVYEKLASLDRRFDARIRAIPQPAGDSAILGKIAAGHEDQAAAAERRANLLRHYDASTYESAVKEGREEQTRLYALEQGYGFKVCGNEHPVSSGPSGGSSASSPSTTAASTEPKHLRIGESGAVGSLSIRPTSFVRLPSSGEAVKWRVTVTVKNDGSSGAQPFCGDGAASLTDEAGRVYEGESVVNEANSVNCGDRVQPGLSSSPFIIDFKMPASAKPATLAMWGESEYEEQAQMWTVP